MKYNRLQALREYILKNHKVEITDVAEKMQVSVETVRRDFGVLEEEGFLKKVYGGAELADDNVMPMLMDAWGKRMKTAKKEKEAIAEKALEWIPDNSVIALDSGTTLYCLARRLKAKSNLTVVSNSLYNVMEISNNSDNLVYCIGGAIKKNESISTGFIASNFLGFFSRFDLALISSDGITPDEGLTDFSMDMCLVKREFLKKCEKIIMLVDHTKFGINAGYKTCDFSDVDVLITDKAAPEEMLKKFRDGGSEIVLV
jgi:DeoR/GlpR family transcriptional regulator of sugar metabolism